MISQLKLHNQLIIVLHMLIIVLHMLIIVLHMLIIGGIIFILLV